jgi:flagellar hook-length control protein FliK
MEIVPTLPPELLAVAGLEGRAPTGFPRPIDADGDPAAAALPFDFLLAQLAGEPLPAGDPLPPIGNGLPVLAAPLPALAPPVAAPPLPTDAAPAAPPVSPLPLVPVPVDLPASAAVLAAAARPAVPHAESAPAAAVPGDGPRAAAPSALAPEPTPQLIDSVPVPRPLAAVAAELPPAALPARPVLTPADLAQPQPAARVLAALAAAASPPPQSNTGARRAPEPAAPAATVAARDGAASAAPQAQPALPELTADPVPVAVGGDAPSVAREAAHTQGQPLPLAGFGAVVDSAAQTSTLGPAPAHAPATPAAGAATASAPAPTLTPTHTEAAVDTTADRWHEALATRVQWIVDQDLGEARIKLSPPELGALDVKISLQDDKTFVQLTAVSAGAREELAHGLPRLRELLSMNGLELAGATVNGGRDDRGARHGPADFPVRSLDFGAAAEAPAVSPTRSRITSRIDIFA